MLQQKKLLLTICISSTVILGLYYFNNKRLNQVLSEPVTGGDSAPLVKLNEAEEIASNSPVIQKPKPASVSSSQNKWKHEKTKLLSDLLETKNDNDPRYDTELKVLSEAEKSELKEFYSDLPSEQRNERGAVVFLLGRNITSAEDLEFFNSVLAEPACLSFQDCTKSQPQQPHEKAVLELSLSYPQVMALEMLKGYIEANKPLSEQARKVVEGYVNHPNHRISNLARRILQNKR